MAAMTARGSILRAIAATTALASLGLSATPASANWLERPSVGQRQPSDVTRPARCDAATQWTRQTFKAFASCQASIYGLEPVLAHAVIEIESGFQVTPAFSLR